MFLHCYYYQRRYINLSSCECLPAFFKFDIHIRVPKDPLVKLSSLIFNLKTILALINFSATTNAFVINAR